MTKLLARLTQQLRDKGNKNPRGMAAALLTKQGSMKDGKLTAKGEKRQSLGAAGRAKDRAAKRLGGKPGDYAYNPRTNHAGKRES